MESTIVMYSLEYNHLNKIPQANVWCKKSQTVWYFNDETIHLYLTIHYSYHPTQNP